MELIILALCLGEPNTVQLERQKLEIAAIIKAERSKLNPVPVPVPVPVPKKIVPVPKKIVPVPVIRKPVIDDHDHYCNNCGLEITEIAEFNSDGTHTHACPCGNKWKHPNPPPSSQRWSWRRR